MHDAKGNGRWARDKPVLTETTTYLLEIGSADKSRPSRMQPRTCADVKESDLVKLYREGKRSFPKADLHGANLQGASLLHIRLTMADLRQANLRGANLQGARLRGADLEDADLREADLRGANLKDANLIGAKLTGAKLDDVTQISTTWRLIWETVNDGNNGHKPS
jgi:uncharacterized protein YjbI with pentapeptide repeats